MTVGVVGPVTYCHSLLAMLCVSTKIIGFHTFPMPPCVNQISINIIRGNVNILMSYHRWNSFFWFWAQLSILLNTSNNTTSNFFVCFRHCTYGMYCQQSFQHYVVLCRWNVSSYYCFITFMYSGNPDSDICKFIKIFDCFAGLTICTTKWPQDLEAEVLPCNMHQQVVRMGKPRIFNLC